jgi:hypothetical protein
MQIKFVSLGVSTIDHVRINGITYVNLDFIPKK